MSFPSDFFRQTATYWRPGTSATSGATYDKYGDPDLSSPFYLSDQGTRQSVRWEDKAEKFIRDNGDEEMSHAIVWSNTTAFAVGGYLYKGHSTATDPETVRGAFQILRVEAIPDIKGRNTIYKAIL